MNASAQSVAVPTPQSIDDAAKEFLELKKKLEVIKAETEAKVKPLADRMMTLAEELKQWTQQFGSAHALKSKLLTGLIYEAMTTVSSTSTLDQAGVALFLEVCKKSGRPKLFGQIFESLTSYRARPEADQVVRTRFTPRLALAYSKCFLTKTNAPSLQVRPRKKEPAAAAGNGVS